jgi:predicted amidohydrolase YtcJ
VKHVLIFGFIAMTLSCGRSTTKEADTNAGVGATMYFNGDIITMAGDSATYVEALVVKDGSILFAGPKEEAMKMAGKGHTMVDLQGKTLMPGFIDTHGHFIYYGRNQLDGDLGGVKNIPELIARMQEHLKNVPEGAWVVGMGYNPLLMEEKRHPTAEELDKISPDRPVMVVHTSGHGGSMNTTLMKLMKIDASTKDPEGGEFLRKPGSKDILGPMEETALISVRNQRPKASPEEMKKIIEFASRDWAKSGQTTAMECGMGLGADDIDIVRNAIDKALMPLDLVVFAKESETDNLINAAYSVGQAYTDKPASNGVTALLEARPDMDKRYANRIRLGGIKFWLDGNPVTAWMSEDYTHAPPGRDPHFRGYSQIPDSLLQSFFDKYWKTNMQINMHVLGDAATEQALRIIENTVKKQGMSDHRPVFVHAGYQREDQIARMKKVGGIPTYLAASFHMSADVNEPMWGKLRTDNANAARSVLNNGGVFTISHDAPITAPVLLPGVWTAVNRTSLSGRTVGEHQKVTPYQALKAVTAWAAYQLKEEKSKGTLEAGKLADLVILDKNPLKVDPMEIRNIQVLETLKEGKTIFKKQ